MEVVPGSSSEVVPSPEIIPSPQRLCQGDALQECHRPLQGQRGTEPPLLSTQERNRQETCDPRSLSAQSPDTMPVLQDGVSQGGSEVRPPERLADVDRLEGRVLARPHSAPISEVPCLLAPRGNVCVQGNAVWSEHCPENLYEVDSGSVRSTEGDGCPVLRVPGRLADSGRIPSRGDSSHRAGGAGADERRIPYQPSEVFPGSSSSHRVARVDMGHQVSSFGVPSCQGRGSRVQAKRLCQESNVLPAVSRIPGRVSQLGGERRHGGSSLLETGKCLPVATEQESPEGHKNPNVPGVGASPDLLEEVADSRPVATPGLSSAIGYCSNRCVPGRLGVPYLLRSGRKGAVVARDCLPPHQPLGDVGGSHSSEVPEPQSTARSHSVGQVRQHNGSQLPVSGRLSQITSLKQVDTEDLVTGTEEELALAGSVPEGSSELQGRCPLEEQAHSDGMVSGPGLVRLVVTADIHPPPKSTCVLRRTTQGCPTS